MPPLPPKTSRRNNTRLDGDKLSVFDFGRKLLETKDIDPVYVILNEVLKGPWTYNHDLLYRWLVSYWCFYHVGTANALAGSAIEGAEAVVVTEDWFWKRLAAAAATKEYPRSTERRHFRGENAISCVSSLLGLRLTCAELVTALGSPTESPSFLECARRVKTHRGFGDWAAFKIADMLERLGLCPVQFKPSDVFNMFDSPRKGAKLVAATIGLSHGGYKDVFEAVYETIEDELSDILAPPRYERKINIQEIETILCKWHSYMHGHYHIGKDIHEVHEALKKFSKYRTSQDLLAAGKTGGLW